MYLQFKLLLDTHCCTDAVIQFFLGLVVMLLAVIPVSCREALAQLVLVQLEKKGTNLGSAIIFFFHYSLSFVFRVKIELLCSLRTTKPDFFKTSCSSLAS